MEVNGIEKPVKRKVGRPGRKKLDTEAKSRRTAQNRAAQRAFRERKEAKLKSLEDKIYNLEDLNKHNEREAAFLKEHLLQLIDEVNKFRPKNSKDTKIFSFLKESKNVKEVILRNVAESEKVIEELNAPIVKKKLTTSSSSSSPSIETAKQITIKPKKKIDSVGTVPSETTPVSENNSPNLSSESSITQYSSNNDNQFTSENIFQSIITSSRATSSLNSDTNANSPIMLFNNEQEVQHEDQNNLNFFHEFNTQQFNDFSNTWNNDHEQNDSLWITSNDINYFDTFQNSLAFPTNNDDIYEFGNGIASDNSTSTTETPTAVTECECRKQNTCTGKEIKCDLIKRHVIKQEDLKSILTDKSFLDHSNKEEDQDFSKLSCAQICARIMTLPRYSEVDIENLCTELITKAKFSDDDKVTVNSSDLKQVLNKQL